MSRFSISQVCQDLEQALVDLVKALLTDGHKFVNSTY